MRESRHVETLVKRVPDRCGSKCKEARGRTKGPGGWRVREGERNRGQVREEGGSVQITRGLDGHVFDLGFYSSPMRSNELLKREITQYDLYKQLLLLCEEWNCGSRKPGSSEKSIVEAKDMVAPCCSAARGDGNEGSIRDVFLK